MRYFGAFHLKKWISDTNFYDFPSLLRSHSHIKWMALNVHKPEKERNRSQLYSPEFYTFAQRRSQIFVNLYVALRHSILRSKQFENFNYFFFLLEHILTHIRAYRWSMAYRKKPVIAQSNRCGDLVLVDHNDMNPISICKICKSK